MLSLPLSSPRGLLPLNFPLFRSNCNIKKQRKTMKKVPCTQQTFGHVVASSLSVFLCFRQTKIINHTFINFSLPYISVFLSFQFFKVYRYINTHFFGDVFPNDFWDFNFIIGNQYDKT